MSRIFVVLAITLVIASACNQPSSQAPEKLTGLPDDPCAVLSADDVTDVTGGKISTEDRGPTRVKVEAETNSSPDPGPACFYATDSKYGKISIVIPKVENRSSSKYQEERKRSFDTFPDRAIDVPGLGEDAWLSDGNSLHVLIDEDEYFHVATELYEPTSKEVLVKIARRVIARVT